MKVLHTQGIMHTRPALYGRKAAPRAGFFGACPGPRGTSRRRHWSAQERSSEALCHVITSHVPSAADPGGRGGQLSHPPCLRCFGQWPGSARLHRRRLAWQPRCFRTHLFDLLERFGRSLRQDFVAMFRDEDVVLNPNTNATELLCNGVGDRLRLLLLCPFHLSRCSHPQLISPLAPLDVAIGT